MQLIIVSEHFCHLILSLSFEQIMVCFRIISDFMVPLSTDGNCRVKALENTINLFRKYNLKSLKIKKDIKDSDNFRFWTEGPQSVNVSCSGSEYLHRWKLVLTGS